MRNVRNAGHQLTEGFVGGLGLFIQRGDVAVDFAHFLLNRRGILALFAQLSHFGALRVLQGFKLLGFCQRGAALGVQCSELIDIELISARGQTLGDGVEVGSEGG